MREIRPSGSMSGKWKRSKGRYSGTGTPKGPVTRMASLNHRATSRLYPGAGPGSFDLLGFTHYWGRSRRGYWVVKRKTATSRLSRALTRMAQWCRLNRHQPLAEQHQTLSQKLHGHFAYYGITGNGSALQRFRDGVVGIWKKWLARRRRRGFLSWEDFGRLLKRYVLPPARVIHSVYRQ